MPSPFPGMDPYLENPGLWPDVHHEFMSVAREILHGQLRPKYLVRIEERVYISDENDPGRKVIAPDLRITDRPGFGAQPFAPTTGGLAVAEPLVVTTLIDSEINEAFLEILDREQRQVVTVIEIVSPANKVVGARGRDSYLQKRRQVMNSSSHWVEIDLLRTGEPTFSRELIPPHDYLAHVSRRQQRPEGRVWPIRLPQRLPVIDIPLRPEDQEAKLDLQQVLTTVYDRAGYDLEIDYRAAAVPPLTGDSEAWAQQLLQSKGLR